MQSGSALALAALLASHSAQAAPIYWDAAPGSSDWGTLGNWNTDGITDANNPPAAPGTGDIAVFNRSTATQPTFSGSPTIGAIWLTGTPGATTITAPGTGTPSFFFTGGQTINSVSNVGLWMDDSMNTTLTVAFNPVTTVYIQADQTFYIGTGNTLTMQGSGATCGIRLKDSSNNSHTLTIDGAGTANLGRWNYNGQTGGTIIKKGAGTMNNAGGWSTNATIEQVQLNGGTYNLNFNWSASKLTHTAGFDFTGTATLGLNGAGTDFSSKIKLEDGATATIDTGAINAVYTSAFQVGSSGNGAFAKAGTGALFLNAPETYTGETTVKAGTLALGIPAVSSSTPSCTTVIGSPLVTVPSTSGLVPGQSVSGTGIPVGTVINQITTATQIQMTKNATAGGTPTLTFAAYAGSTVGGLSASSGVHILAGATFDVSGLGASATYTLGTSAYLAASGTGTTGGTTAATIKGGTSGTVSLGSRPITLTYDGSNPALYVSQGTLALTGNAFTVNSVSPLADGDHTLVQQATGSITSGGTYPAVTGTAIGTGKTGAITISGNTVVLTVSGATSPYTTWAGTHAFDSLNSEGVAYGMAWMLGASNNSSPAIGLLPQVMGSSGSGFTVHFTRVLDPGAAKLYLEYSDNLGSWSTPVEVIVGNGHHTDPGGSGITFDVTTTGGLYDITALVPLGTTGKRFARMEATE